MPYGYWGRILRVDLTSGLVSVDEPGEKFYRTYLGGRGIVAYYLFKEVPRGVDPLGPENVLVIANSVISGQALPGTARTSIGAKSPLTGVYGDGEGGGHFGPRLAWAGYDGLVITGRSAEPVYLWVNDRTVELRSAKHLWGLDVYETQEAARSEIGDNQASAAMIGPAGERLISFACIALGCHNYVGRAGLGAVMGAKKLKAVVVNGKKRPEPANPEEIKAQARWLGENYKKVSAMYAQLGTPGLVTVLNAASGLPTRNFNRGAFEDADKISGQYLLEAIGKDVWGCFACPIKCKRVVEVEDEGLKVDRRYGGPEYETIGAFGSNCGVNDLKAVAKANELCDRAGLDTISAGMMISGAMECAEKGLLPADLFVNLDLKFGSAEGMLDLLERIINRQGLGDLLAKGPKKVTELLGPDAGAHFLTIKGQPLPMHEPRWKTGMGIGFVLSPTGADHMHNMHDPVYSSEKAPTFAAARQLGILDPVDSLALGPAKARMWLYLTMWRSLNNSLLICYFTPYALEQVVKIVQASTGWDVTSWELIKASERAMNLARAFNAREGLTAADDVLPERMFEMLKGGANDGQVLNRQVWMDTRDLIYDMLGWDRRTAAPKQFKLFELGLDWVAKELAGYGLD